MEDLAEDRPPSPLVAHGQCLNATGHPDRRVMLDTLWLLTDLPALSPEPGVGGAHGFCWSGGAL